jgi:hypothetical protein
MQNSVLETICYPIINLNMGGEPFRQYDVIGEYNEPLTIISNKEPVTSYTITDSVIDQHIQPNDKLLIPISVMHDGVAALGDYPFNTLCPSKLITEIIVKLEGATIEFTNNSLTSNKPIMVELRGSTLCIWTTKFVENNVLTSNGDTVLNGYKIEGFDMNSIKVKHQFSFDSWQLYPMVLKKFVLTGSNNTVTFSENCFDQNCNIKILGKNSVHITANRIAAATIYITFSDIHFNTTVIDNLQVEIEGSGSIQNATVGKISTKIVGDGFVAVKERLNLNN